MRIGLQGGFGEKGRTSVLVRTPSASIMLDAGIMVGARGGDYYPHLLTCAERIDALFISHAHEDHVGAVCRLLRQGYRGRILMSAETRDQMTGTLEQYAEPQDLADFPPPLERIEIFRPGDTIRVGDLEIGTGHSGHVVGGVWFSVTHRGRTLVYCADVVPESPVFRMDMLPACDLLMLDASYGADPVPGGERAAQIARWVSENPGGCLLPTPLSGRSLELIRALDGPFAVAADMRRPLEEQISDVAAFHAGVAGLLGDRLQNAADWRSAQPLPQCPLLVHDGMGVAGPARDALARADAEDYPVLLTGHLPPGSPAAKLMQHARATWIRMPTHPTAPENVRIWEASGRPAALGHSCAPEELERLREVLPALAVDCRTGQELSLNEV